MPSPPSSNSSSRTMALEEIGFGQPAASKIYCRIRSGYWFSVSSSSYHVDCIISGGCGASDLVFSFGKHQHYI